MGKVTDLHPEDGLLKSILGLSENENLEASARRGISFHNSFNNCQIIVHQHNHGSQNESQQPQEATPSSGP